MPPWSGTQPPTVVDPLPAVQRISGRPVLMVNGQYDRTVTPAQAERLFAAAGEPKTMRWYGGGHWPPVREIAEAAKWLSARLRLEERTETPAPVASRTPRTKASTGAGAA